MQRTLILVKPDGVRRGLTGEVLRRFEARGIRIIALKMTVLSRQKAALHYAEHDGKPFFPGLIEFITSGPLVAAVLAGSNVVNAVRAMMGSTDPAVAHPGSIRGDYALTMSHNIIHGSDGEESAGREIALFFSPDEIHE